MSDIEVDAEKLQKMVFIDAIEDVLCDIRFIVQCNYCSNGSAIFYEGDYLHLPDADWLVKAAQHMVEYHP